MTDTKKPLPDLTDKATAAFWRNTHAGRLTAPRCTHCTYLLWPPEVVCPECQHTEFAWEDVPTRGTLWSYAVYHRAFHPGFKDEIPYVVGIVETEDGVRYTGRIDGTREAMAVGAAVEAVFVDESEAFTLPRWRLMT